MYQPGQSRLIVSYRPVLREGEIMSHVAGLRHSAGMLSRVFVRLAVGFLLLVLALVLAVAWVPQLVDPLLVRLGV
jgi:hypothetical protein